MDNRYYDDFEKLIDTILKINPNMTKEYDQDGVGSYGEDLTVELLRQYVPGYFKLIRNLILPIGETATEIDILMIHEKGVFVFESKNYSGWIFGRKEDQKWTQTFRNVKKYKFYNPIKQNKTHCDAICELTKIPKQYVTSYVVFSERCTLKAVPDNEMQLTIIKRNRMIDEIYRDLAVRNTVFTHEAVDSYHKGFSYYLDNEELKKKHRDNIDEKSGTFKTFKSESERKRFEVKNCPKCGKRLSLVAAHGVPVYMCPDVLGCGFVRQTTREELTAMDNHELSREVLDGVSELFNGFFGGRIF